jgi:4-hydroxybenzoate polyprenyltransferase
MLAIQLGIGAGNDWADAPADAVARPGKPIAAGLVGRAWAARIAVGASAIGLLLAALAGPIPLAVAAAGLAAGLAYDLRLKGTIWSWLPYAIGLPLLPIFAWVGATGALPWAVAVIVPLAMLAGAALAVANALADLERDLAAGVETVATGLGLATARRAGAALQGVVVAGALGSGVALGGEAAGLALAGVGGVVVATGVATGWGASTASRQRGWEMQAVGLGLLAAAWAWALAGAGRLAG